MIPMGVNAEIDSENYFTNSSQITTHRIQRNYLLLTLLTFPLLTIFGNLLVVISVVKERSLRNTTNYYIVSLAVADISLAISVMPLCTWLEVNSGHWEFNGIYCDIFMMLDVMFCTSSILNLAAISIDRYIAVSRPLSYSNNQKFERVYATIGITWLLSFIIALPIAVGLNNTKDRKDGDCKFNNPTFIILSSMLSFYIPSVIVLILYYRIFLIIRKQAQAKIRRQCGKIFENKQNPSPSIFTTSDMGVKYDKKTANPKIIVENREVNSKLHYIECNILCNPLVVNHNKISNLSQKNPTDNASDLKSVEISKPKYDRNEEHLGLLNENIHTEKSKSFNIKRFRKYFPRTTKIKNSENDEGDSDDENDSVKTSSLRLTLQLSTFHTANLIKSTLMLPMRNRKKDNSEKYLASREKKAIKTLVIVLVVFLICWVPFFTLNVTNAICMRFHFSNETYLCSLADSKTASVAVWLGYTNSCVNPIIYTIFNGEFRRSFKKILRL